MADEQEHTQAGFLGLKGLILAPDNVLTAMVRRLEAATSRLEDIASTAYPNGEPGAADASNGAQSPGPAAKLASASSTAPTPKAPAESLPPAIEAYDEMVNTELKTWLELSSMLGEVIEGQSKAVQQAFVAQRQFIFIANKAKKPDDRTVMELLKDLQASMEKTDEVRQQNREAALKDPLAMVADGVGCLGWITISPGSSMKPHEHIKELFGGAQMFGNKVLKEYRDKYEHTCPLVYSTGRLTHVKTREQDVRRVGAGILQAL
jgi:adenylyl cyclase-associated protein